MHDYPQGDIKPPQLLRLMGASKVYATQNKDGSWNKVMKTPTVALMRDHIDGKVTVGTYTMWPGGPGSHHAKTLVFDIDEGDDLDLALENSGKVTEALGDLGVHRRGIAVEFSGSKGYHVWVLFRDYIEAAKLRRLGRATLAVAGLKCEVFPKQDRVRDRKPGDKADPLGSLVKLPGGFHQKTGKPNPFLHVFPKPLGEEELDAILATLPEEPTTYEGPVTAEQYACFAAIQEGPTEGWRNDGLYHGAFMARRGGLNEENVTDLVNKANALAQPSPLPQEEVDQLLWSSADGGPKCEAMHNAGVGCGEFCIAKRHEGLHVRKGEFKFGQPDEFKVVKVKSRKGKLIEIEHPDLTQGKVVLK